MFGSSFSEILKKNLSENSFKSKKKLASNPVFMADLKQHFIKEDDIKYIYGSISFYKKLFKEPVKRIFYWEEDVWEGRLFVVYKYNTKYIYCSGHFGSCELCDNYPETDNELNTIFNENIYICDTIDEVCIHDVNKDYTHPKLIRDFEKFKNKLIRLRNKKLKQHKVNLATKNKVCERDSDSEREHEHDSEHEREHDREHEV